MNYIHKELIFPKKIDIKNHLPKIGIDNVQDEIIAGLKASQKYILPKFFYDKKGSELFEKITKLEEYYPTRTEKEILKSIIPKLNIDLQDLSIVELGSGDASKISLLLKQIPDDILNTIDYFPVDISQSAIEKSINNLVQNFNLKSITGIVADFFHQLNNIPRNNRRLFCFLGSTIGNFDKKESKEFLSMLGNTMQTGDYLLLGLDMVKNFDILERAYNDSEGITARFNKNILYVTNSLINSDFNISDFDHLSFFNTEKSRIEMHLKAKKNVDVKIDSSNEIISIDKNETIHTENSYKFHHEDINTFAIWANLKIANIFNDNNKWFSLIFFRK